MTRRLTIGSILAGVVVLCAIVVSAQQSSTPQGRQGRQGGEGQGRGGASAARASALPMLFGVNFGRPPSQTGQTKVVQENIGEANVELRKYGLHESCLLTSGNPGSDTTPFSVWSGECEQPFATLFRHRANYL